MVCTLYFEKQCGPTCKMFAEVGAGGAGEESWVGVRHSEEEGRLSWKVCVLSVGQTKPICRRNFALMESIKL